MVGVRVGATVGVRVGAAVGVRVGATVGVAVRAGAGVAVDTGVGSPAYATPTANVRMAILEITDEKGYTIDMVKTLLKMIFGVVVLAVVFFAALQLWEKYRPKPSQEAAPVPAVETPAVSAAAIHDVTVIPSGDGAMIQISQLASPDYKITVTSQPNGFIVDVPSVQVAMSSNVVARAHNLVPLIEVAPVSEAGMSGARIKVELLPGTVFKDRYSGGTLFFDLARSATASVRPKAVPSFKEAAPPVPRKALKKKRGSEARSRIPREIPSIPKRATAPKPTWSEEKPKKVAATPKKAPMPSRAEEDSGLMKELGLEEAAPPQPEALIPKPSAELPPPPRAEFMEPPPMVPAVPSPLPSGEKEEPIDMQELYGSGSAGQGLPDAAPKLEPPPQGEIPMEEAPSEVAMVQPPSGERFDDARVTRQLPAITDLTVSNEGGVTTAQIRRGDSKTRYQVFKLINPNRIVIDFLNATNQLQKDYSGFPGTKVQRVSTQEFAGPEGTIARITFYLSGAPAFKTSKNGDFLILKLP
ncbi:MAG: AMIN domain-containing protein [Pseudomonadota bacterium]